MAQTSSVPYDDESGAGIVDQIRRSHEAVVSLRTYLSDGSEIWSRIGSGFLYDRDGYAVTRRCVVEGGDSIIATLADGRCGRAWIVYSDEQSEVALLKLPFNDIVPIAVGRGANLPMYSHVVVLGNAMGVFPSVGMGTYIGLRTDGMMMVEFVVPPGNCGSPVLDGNGKVVGLLMGRMTAPEKGIPRNTQVGIALPIESVRSVIDEMLALARERRGWVGMSVTDIRGRLRGQAVEVVRLVPGGPTEQAEISVGDTLLAINGESIQNAKILAAKVKKIVPGDEIIFTVRKGGYEFSRTVRVGSLPWDEDE